MLNQKQNVYLILILFVILAALISAYMIEYNLGHEPCKLCIYERIPYFLAIFLIVEALFSKKNVKMTLLLLSLIFIISTGLAFYHFGIEQGFFSESFVCGEKNFEGTLSKEQLLENLKKNTISCKNVSFKIMGLSLAAINTIFSTILSIILIRLLKNYGKN
jgi:disulfide bond formation protein DsbB